MKQLIFLALLIATVAVKAQTSTIVDCANHIEINYANGDTISVGKTDDLSLVIHSDEVFLMTGRKWSPGAITRIPSLKASEFGYSSTRALYNYLACICHKEYKETYNYTGGSLDTVKYYYGSTLMHMIVYTYSDGAVATKTPLNSLGQ